MQERSESEGGMGKFSQEAYDDHDIGEYRRRFPQETQRFSNEQLFHIVSNTEDDMEDDEWRSLFKNAA